MDNPNVMLDEDDLSEDEPGETIRLRPYLDWRVSALTFPLTVIHSELCRGGQRYTNRWGYHQNTF